MKDLPLGLRLSAAARDLYASEGPEGLSIRRLSKRTRLCPSILLQGLPVSRRPPQNRGVRWVDSVPKRCELMEVSLRHVHNAIEEATASTR
jgi:hypothetical protein